MGDYLAFLLEKLPSLLIGFPGQRPGGLLLSLGLAVFGIGIGFIIALILGIASQSRWWVWRWLAKAYVEVFRGLPLILLLVIVHQIVGGPRFGFNFSPRASALTALALYSGAYQTEIVRSGLQSVPFGLVEAARTIGAGQWQITYLIKLRQGLQMMLPAFTGQAISLFKDTSVVIIIGVAELMTVARVVLGSDVVNAPYWVGLYMLVGFLYFCVAFGLSMLAQYWERQVHTPELVYTHINY